MTKFQFRYISMMLWGICSQVDVTAWSSDASAVIAAIFGIGAIFSIVSKERSK